jgi:hypothetical protein
VKAVPGDFAMDAKSDKMLRQFIKDNLDVFTGETNPFARGYRDAMRDVREALKNMSKGRVYDADAHEWKEPEDY